MTTEELRNQKEPEALLKKIVNEFSFKDVPIDEVQEMLISDKGSIRNFVGAFQSSEDQLTAVKYIGAP